VPLTLQSVLIGVRGAYLLHGNGDACLLEAVEGGGQVGHGAAPRQVLPEALRQSVRVQDGHVGRPQPVGRHLKQRKEGETIWTQAWRAEKTEQHRDAKTIGQMSRGC
jgi:hypothetical protein